MGDPLSPPMSRDMISANLTFQFVPRLGVSGGEGGMGCGGPAQPLGLGRSLRKATWALGSLSGQLDVMGGRE